MKALHQFRFSIALAMSFFFGLAGLALGQTLQMQFGFDDSGTTTVDSVAGVNLNLLSYGGVATDYHGAVGSGVNSRGRALNLTSAAAGASGPVAVTGANATIDFGSISNFTMTMWIKPTYAIGGAYLPRFFCFGRTTSIPGTNAVQLMNNGSPLGIAINTGTQINSSTFSEPVNQWTFLAVTWNGTNVQFYSGNETNAVVTRGSSSAAVGPVNIGSSFNLALGNVFSRNRPFVGWMDDVRFYTGAANSNFVESVRQQALALDAPTNLTVNLCGGASLAWAPVTGATGYIVQRSTSPGAETNYDVAGANSYLDTNVTVGAAYYYKIIATNSVATTGVASEEVGGTILSGTPFSITAPPASQTVLSGNVATFSVAVTGGSELSYLWQYSIDQGATWTDIPAATTTNYSTAPVTLADDGTQYRVMVVGGCGAVPSAAATLSVLSPHLQFSFEDSGTTTTDSVSGVSLNLINGGGGAADFHGAAGSGVYGHGRALDFSSAVPNAPGPLAFSTNNSAINFGTLTNFTLAFWFKPTVPITSSLCRLFLLSNSGNNVGGVQDSLELLDYNVANSFRMNINTSAIYAQPKAEPTNQWLFFVATWDGQTMKVYRGTETGAVSLQSSVPAAAGAINVGATFNLLLGNTLFQNRPFTGLFDDVRFYTGVANSSFLDSVRQESLIFSAPANVSLTTCGGASLTWSPAPYATGYIVKRSASSGAETNFATTATNVFIDVSATVGNTYYYQVVATNSSSVSASSSEVYGTVQNLSLFTFEKQPASQTVCLGDTPTFTVATSGDPGVAYLWQYSVSAGANWIDIPTANSTNYTAPVVTAADDGTLYRVIVISGCASVPSAVAKLSVATSEATIVQQPVDQTVVAGWSARFAVQATGTNLIYQWRKNGTNLVDGNGVTGSSSTVLTLTNLTVADSGSVYDCVIGPPCVAVPSSPALLTVNADASNNLMLKFDFEDAGNGTTTTDTVHGVTLNLVDANFSPIDLHGQSGSGVAGLGRSLDLSTGTMGGAGPLAYAASDSTINYGKISSFTLTFWVNPATGLSTSSSLYPRYFIMGANTITDLAATGSFGALYTSGLKAAVNTNSVSALSPNQPAGQWMFLAVTWDGQTANYYAGSTNGAVTLLNSVDLPTTPVNIGNAVNLLIGNRASSDRAFAGKMDDIRLYLGAAPVDTLETIRQAALPPVPVASFTAWPVSGVRPLLVTFTNSTVGSSTSLIWNFGDGVTNSSGSNVVTHVYGVEGTYSATLTASESGGSSTATNAITVTVPMQPNITRVAAGSGSLTIQGTNGPISATQIYYYKLLTSTNLALPRASWTVLATNAFNADGSFSNNIPVIPGDSQRFYLQQMP